jgi:hypothetical protein
MMLACWPARWKNWRYEMLIRKTAKGQRERERYVRKRLRVT